MVAFSRHWQTCNGRLFGVRQVIRGFSFASLAWNCFSRYQIDVIGTSPEAGSKKEAVLRCATAPLWRHRRHMIVGNRCEVAAQGIVTSVFKK